MRIRVGSSVFRAVALSDTAVACAWIQDGKKPANGQQKASTTEQKSRDPDRAKRLSGRQIIAQVEGKTDVAAAWDAVLKDFIVSDNQFAEAISQLHEAKKYTLAIEGVQSAIRAGRALPWMYDILALEMKLDNRPEAEIGRVLKSRIDFASANVPQMLIIAAMLSRFEAWNESLTILRDAAEIDPTVEEIWLLARSVSDKSEDANAIIWSRSGVVRNVWSDGYQKHHDEARKAVSVLIEKLDRAGESPKAQSLRQEFAEAEQLDLEVTVRWVGKADVDLAVVGPNGDVCNYAQPLTASGGRLLRDSTNTAADAKVPASETHYEKFLLQKAANGQYRVELRFISGTIPSGSLLVDVIQHKGAATEKKETRSLPLKKDVMTLTVDLSDGRAIPARP